MQNRESESDKNLLSIQQAAERLGVSANMVRDLIESRRLKAINLAEKGNQRYYRIKPEWIDELIADSELPSPKQRPKQSQNLRPSKYATHRSHS